MSISATVNAAEEIRAGTVCLLTLTWTLTARTPGDEPMPVVLQFDCRQTGETWYDRHVRPALPPLPAGHDTPSASTAANANRTLIYTIPVWLPPHPENRTWQIAAHVDSQIITGIGTLDVNGQSPFQRRVEPVFVSGWHDIASDASSAFAGFYDLECPSGEPACWRWMSGTGSVTFTNPRTPLRLQIEGSIPDTIQETGIRLLINGSEWRPATAVSGKLLIDDIIPAERLGNTDKTVLTLETTRTFVPAASSGNSTDTRELGVMLNMLHLDIAPDGPETVPFLDAVHQTALDPEWKWMENSSSLVFQNPGKTVTIFMKCRIPDHLFIPGIGLRIGLNDAVIDHVVPAGNVFSLMYRIPVETMDTAGDIAFTIDLDSPALPLQPLPSQPLPSQPLPSQPLSSPPLPTLPPALPTLPLPQDPAESGSPPAGMVVSRIWIN